YFFELSQPLSLGRQYTVRLNSTLKDITGTTFGTGRDIKFTTRTTAYESGSVIENFDDISVFWDPDASGSTTGTDNPLTTFKASPLIKMAGTNAGRLDYVFTNPAGGVCRVFDTRKPVIGQNATSKFGVWVFGDMSMNILEYWFYSAGTANQIVFADTIDWAGWDLKMIPFTSIGGTGDRQYHSVVVRQTAPGVRHGTLWFDDAMTVTLTGIDNPSEADVSLAVFPNPVTSEGTVTFNLSGRSLVTLDVYSSEGRKVEQIINAPMEPGLKSLRWLPSAALPDGVYLLRLEVKGSPGASSTPTVIRCILAR
ncbi:MAG: T9SS type A sorting domain-containing protein, partial [Bacteroidia bacterium]